MQDIAMKPNTFFNNILTGILLTIPCINSFCQERAGPVGGGFGYNSIVTREMADETISNWQELKTALVTAGNNPGYTIYIDENNEIDLTNESYTGGYFARIPDHTTLASNRGQNHSSGALIFTGNDYPDLDYIFSTGDNVRISGIRFEGPDKTFELTVSNCSGSSNNLSAIKTSGKDIEIDNCDFFGWTTVAIWFNYTKGVQSDIPNGYVHHNLIHRNSQCGLGYGITSSGPTNPRIENNIFDFNKHSIAGAGNNENQNYSAKYNLVLKNVRQGEYPFEIHGQYEQSIYDPTGTSVYAGNIILIEKNSFLSSRAVYLKGVPYTADSITNNFFITSRCESVTQGRRSETPYLDSFGNVTGYRPEMIPCGNETNNFIVENNYFDHPVARIWQVAWGGRSNWAPLSYPLIGLDQVKFGDFDGDSSTDIFFQHDGKWWVAFSGLAPLQSINISQMHASNFGLGDFDGDGKTDIFYATGSEWKVSYSRGRGNNSTPWETVGISALTLADISFGDFDGDGKTDIFRTTGQSWEVSFCRGRGVLFSPWEQFGISNNQVSDQGFRF